MVQGKSSKSISYSDEDLAAFKLLLETKLEKVNEDLRIQSEQIENLNETIESDGDWMDDTSNASELEMLYTLSYRSKTYKKELENALKRVMNKSFGVCSITGELIDKRRLMAVPTTTKSLLAKNTEAEIKPQPKRAPIIKSDREKIIITKVISKSSSAINPPNPVFEEEEDFDLDFDQDLDELQLGTQEN